MYSTLWVYRLGFDDAVLEIVTGKHENPVRGVLARACNAWLEHDSVFPSRFSIEYKAGDSARLIRWLSNDPTFDPNRKIVDVTIQVQPMHPLYYFMVSGGEWSSEAACALLSTRGIDVLLPSGEDDYTVLESVMRCHGSYCIDPFDTVLVQATPAEALTRAPLTNSRVRQWNRAPFVPVEQRPHNCSVLAFILDRYVCYGGNALDAVVHAFGVDSNGMDLDCTCVVCTRNACTPKVECVTAAAKDRRREALLTLDQLRVAVRKYKTELPLLLKRLFDAWCPGASAAVCVMTTGYLRYDAPPGVSWLTPKCATV